MSEDKTFQFSTRALFLLTACAAIAVGGSAEAARIAQSLGVSAIPAIGSLLYVSPWWIPFAFVAYILGQRRLTVRTTVVFAMFEALSIGVMRWAAML